MILPGEHKTLWEKLDNIKAANPGKSYMYSQDPFQTDRETRALRAEKEKLALSEKMKKENERKDIARSMKEAISSEKAAASSTTSSNSGTTNLTKKSSDEPPPEKRPRFNKVLTMSKEGRNAVEKIIKKFHGFESQFQDSALDPSSDVYKSVSRALIKIGFANYQVAEALETCSTLTDAVEWLLIHVPEDDLPESFANNKYKTFFASLQSNDLKYEYAVRDIRAMGYTEDLVRSQLDQVSGNKRLAIVALTNSLCSDDVEASPTESIDEQESIDMWQEELASLDGMYSPEELTQSENDYCCFNLSSFNGDDKISLYLWRGPQYPAKIPGITIEALNTKLPKYALLDLIKRTGQYAAQNLTGEFMLMSLAEWLKDNFEEIQNNPCRLSELSQGVIGVKEEIDHSAIAQKAKRSYKPRTYVRPKIDSQKLLDEHNFKLKTSAKLKQMIEDRKTLPAWKKKEGIFDLIANNQVTLVTGETGSGKSTQVAQFVLDNLIERSQGGTVNIICSQPRRISAMGLAQRVADERASEVGDEVGYVIRGESKTSPNTMLRFVTTGVLVRMLQSGETDSLSRYSHIFVDEVHERSLDSDFLLILLKRVISVEKNLKIVLMSATVDPALFIQYFGGEHKVGYTHIEGRTFPIEDYYLDSILDMTGYMPPSLLAKPKSRYNGRGNRDSRNNRDDRDTRDDNDDEDDSPPIKGPIDIGQKIIALRNSISYDLITTLVQHIDRELGDKDGAILIFLPGVAEIDRCINSIVACSERRFMALPLHASLSPAEQRKVFPVAPRGKRKIVVSTNVAETSITIPDIVAVIDSGKAKETRYDTISRSMQLIDCWISKAAAKQRRGRAGRVRQGTCYKLFTKVMEGKEMPERPLPEILRAPLEQLYLSVKAMGIKDTFKFLGEAIDPPETSAIESARITLVEVGALKKPVNGNESNRETDLTALGKHMSMIPADLRCAKLLVLSSILGFVDIGLTIAAILSLRSPFMSNKDTRDDMRQAMKRFGATHPHCGPGDLLVQTRAYEEWSAMRHKGASQSDQRRWCKENFLSHQTLQDIQSARRQYISNLQEIGFLPPGNHANLHPGSGLFALGKEISPTGGMVQAVIGASMSPNIANIVMPDKVFKNIGVGSVELDLTDSRGIKFFSPHERLFTHPSSTLFMCTKFTTSGARGVPADENEDGEYLSYARKMQTSKLFMDGLTPLNCYGLVFFAEDVAVDPLGSGIVVDGWLGLKCWPRIGILIKILRNLFNDVMEQKLSNPGMDLQSNEIIQTIQRLTESNGLIRSG